jgi:hypothetical protein
MSGPKKAAFDDSVANDLGWLPLEFDVLEPSDKYSFDNRKAPDKNSWPTIVPANAPPVGQIPQVIQRLMDSLWKFAEPSAAAARGDIMIGVRDSSSRMRDFIARETYHPQVRPTSANIPVKVSNAAIADDWKTFEQIPRTNAVTFRGDTRAPYEVIVKQGGFHPPNSRTDRYYLENNIYEAFADYFRRRYGGDKLDKQFFLQTVDKTLATEGHKVLLVDYMMWRKICEGESMHLGRMASNECLKGYISTARAIDTSISFGTAFNKKAGWLYVTMVHGGFVVPWGLNTTAWSTAEAEIAQWGSIPGERIVGFRHLGQFAPDGPVYMRKSFQKQEPKAFKTVFNYMCGMTPTA